MGQNMCQDLLTQCDWGISRTKRNRIIHLYFCAWQLFSWSRYSLLWN